MIIFARHGETRSGAEERFEGFSDSSLTKKGEMQAEALADYLRQELFSTVLVSPRGRALATAIILKREFLVDEKFSEICYGSWETTKRDEKKKTNLWKQREDDFFHFPHPGFYKGNKGESYEELYTRLSPALSDLTKLEGNTLIVAHSGVMRCAMRFFIGIDDNAFKNAKFSNGVIFFVDKTKQSLYLYDVVERQFLKTEW